MKYTKYIIPGALILAIIGGVGVYYTFVTPKILSPILSGVQSAIVNTTEANPDYICVKQVENAPCGDLDNPPWNGTQTRVRTGRRVTSVAYYSVRIGCAEGGVGTVVGEAGGASGRRTADFPYSYGDACTVVETDTITPDADPVAN